MALLKFTKNILEGKAIQGIHLPRVSNQFRQAIALYYQRTPGAAKRYPAKLEDLLEDKRYPNTARYLRKLYADPMTGKPEWGWSRRRVEASWGFSACPA